jgi:hypothetical protein
MIKVLVSDDNRRLFEPWSEKAVKFDIELNCFSNWEEAQFELDNNWEDYEFVILDGKGKIQEESPEANKKHLITAVNWLKEQKGNGKYKPVVIYTGFYEAIEDIVIKDTQILEIFDKDKREIEDVLKFIITESKKTPDRIIKNIYPDVFEIFEKRYLDNDVEKMLLSLLKETRIIQGNDLRPFSTKIRSIQESIYKNLNHYFPNILPNDCFKSGNGMVEFNKAKSLLSGKKKDVNNNTVIDKKKDIQGTDIENLSNSIYWVSGNIIHYEKDRVYYPSKYAIQSLVYALLEQLLWYKTTVDKLLKK